MDPITLEPISDIGEFVKVRDAGKIAYITEELFYYFLEVLPPQAMNTAVKMPDGRMQSTAFLFAEGREPMTAFWTMGKGENARHMAQLTNILNPNW